MRSLKYATITYLHSNDLNQQPPRQTELWRRNFRFPYDWRNFFRGLLLAHPTLHKLELKTYCIV